MLLIRKTRSKMQPNEQRRTVECAQRPEGNAAIRVIFKVESLNSEDEQAYVLFVKELLQRVFDVAYMHDLSIFGSQKFRMAMYKAENLVDMSGASVYQHQIAYYQLEACDGSETQASGRIDVSFIRKLNTSLSSPLYYLEHYGSWFYSTAPQRKDLSGAKIYVDPLPLHIKVLKVLVKLSSDVYTVNIFSDVQGLDLVIEHVQYLVGRFCDLTSAQKITIFISGSYYFQVRQHFYKHEILDNHGQAVREIQYFKLNDKFTLTLQFQIGSYHFEPYRLQLAVLGNVKYCGTAASASGPRKQPHSREQSVSAYRDHVKYKVFPIEKDIQLGEVYSIINSTLVNRICLAAVPNTDGYLCDVDVRDVERFENIVSRIKIRDRALQFVKVE